MVDSLGSLKSAGIVTLGGITSGNLRASCSLAGACFACRMTSVRPYMGDYYVELTPYYKTSCTITGAPLTLTVQVPGSPNDVSVDIQLPYKLGGHCTMLDPTAYTSTLPTRRFGDPVTVATATITLSTTQSACNLFIAPGTALNKPIQDSQVLPNIGYPVRNLSPNVAAVSFPAFQITQELAPSSNGISVSYASHSPTTTLGLTTGVVMTQFSQTFFVKTPFMQVNFDYPFGFKSGHLPQYIHATELPFSNLQSMFNARVTIQNEQSQEYPINTNSQQDILPPFLESFQIISDPGDPYTFTYRVVAGDKESGLYSITIEEEIDTTGLRTVVLKEGDAKLGDAFYGTFERSVTLVGIQHTGSLRVTFCDRVGNKVIYRSGDYIPIWLTQVTYFPVAVLWNLRDITSFSFANSLVDTTVAMPTNTIYFNLSNPDKRMRPRIRMNFFAVTELNSQFEFVGSYVEANSRYEIQYTVPRYITNDVNFYLYGTDIIQGAAVLSIYNTITSGYDAGSKVDMMSPVISSAMPFPSKSISFETAGGRIGWNLTIACPTAPNQRCQLPVWGYVIVKGDSEPMTRNITIPTISSATDKFNFDFPITQNCTSQVFRIVYVLLTDGIHTSKSNTPGLIDPAIYMLAQGPSTVSILCNTNADTQPPTLLSLSINSTSIDVSKGSRTIDSERSLLVQFSTTDESGIKVEALPTIFVTSLFGEKLSIVSKLDLCVLNVCQYSAIIEFPFGFGSSDFYVSLSTSTISITTYSNTYYSNTNYSNTNYSNTNYSNTYDTNTITNTNTNPNYSNTNYSNSYSNTYDPNTYTINTNYSNTHHSNT
eukprot:gene6403-7427_t